MKIFARKKPKRQIRLEKVFEKNGNTFYKYVDPLELPGPRLRAAEIAAVEADLSINSKDGIALLDKVFAEMNKGSFVQASAILVELYRRFKALAEEETFLKLATVYFVMNDEDETKYNLDEQELKIKVLKADEELKSFFLSAAAEHTKNYSKVSQETIMKYLEENQEELQKIEKYLSRK
jgi:hypothetical protein